MKAVVTRVSSASVVIDGMINGSIEKGFLVLLGIGPEDDQQAAELLSEKILNCRVFPDTAGKMNLNLEQAGGSLLVVSQFTLFADLKSRRPGFSHAAKPDIAEPLYDEFVDEADKKFYEVAKHCGATLITGNIKHFPSDEIIMTANDFLGKYL